MAALEDEMGAEGFWDDSERAAAVSAEHSRALRRLEMFRVLQDDAEDLEGLAEMAADATTESTPQRLAAIREQLKLLADYL